MDISNKYCIYAGSARGTLQYTFCKPAEKLEYHIPEEQSEITALEWGRSEDEIIIGYKNESIQLYNTLQTKYTKTITTLEGEGPIVGVAPLKKMIIAAKRDGIISIWNRKKSDYFSINLEEKGSLEAMVYNKNRENVIGTGGEFNDFKLWDLETKQCVFKAKSIGHDELNLPIQTSIRSITSLPGDRNLYACATKEGHILLYDEKAQRRPVVKFLEKKASYTCIASAFRERQCLAGTTKGYMQLIDLRSPGKSARTFTNFTGSVTSIDCDCSTSVVAATSLDRFLRVFDLDTKDLLHKVYMKQSLTKVLLKPLIKEEIEDYMEDKIEEDGEIGDVEYEEMFKNMETITDSKEKSSERRASFTTPMKKKKKTSLI